MRTPRALIAWIASASLLACAEPEPALLPDGATSPDGAALQPDGAVRPPDAAHPEVSCDADRLPPSVPTGLTARVEGDAIELAWEPSTDAVGVAGYRVHRDGVPVATTTAPAHRDTDGLVAGSAHAYWITAFDAAGGESQRSGGASAALPPLEARLDDGVDDDGDGWLETSAGFRLRAAHPRVACDPEHLATVLARMHGPEARDPWHRWFELVRSEADAGSDVGPLALALLYRATSERRYLDRIVERLGLSVPSVTDMYALDLVFDDVPREALRALQARVAGDANVFHYGSVRAATEGRARWGYHSAHSVAPALAYAAVLAFTEIELDPSAPADRFDTFGYLRAVHGELLPEGHFWQTESHIAGDPTHLGDALAGTYGGMYDNLAYDSSEESASVYVLHAWHSLTGQARHRGALHDEHRARFWHSLRLPSTERTHMSDAYCARAGARHGNGVVVWNTRTSVDQPPAEAAALAAWLYQDGLMQDFVVNGRDLERCSAPHRGLAYWLLYYDDALEPTPPSALPDATYFAGPGIVTSRTGWEPGVTFALFAAGDGISRRYEDGGSFLLHRRGPVAVHAGGRIRFEPANDRHHWFHVRSASKNTLRIYDPGEVFDERGALSEGWPLVPSDNLGGQMFETMYARTDLTWPISSGGVSGRRGRPGAPLDEQVDIANVLAFEHRPSVYAYALADVTPAYSAKVERLERSFVHVRPDVLLIFDRLRTADPSFRRVWTAHTVPQPISTEVVERGFGVVDHGAVGALTLEGGEDAGRLFVLAPEARALRVRGGETVLRSAPLRSTAPWSEPSELAEARWFDILAAGSDVAGTITIEGVDSEGATVREDVTLASARRTFASGAPSSVSAGSVVVEGAGWRPDQWVGHMVELSNGRFAPISGNDEQTLFAPVSAGASWFYRIQRVLANTRTPMTRVTGVSTGDVDLDSLALVVPHHFDTPDAIGRVHSFSPHTDGRADAYFGDPQLGRYTIELESLDESRDAFFFVAFSLADAGREPASVEGRRGEGAHAAVIDDAAYVMVDSRLDDGARVSLPAHVRRAHVFGLAPGGRYVAQLDDEVLVIAPGEPATGCASAAGTLTASRD